MIERFNTDVVYEQDKAASCASSFREAHMKVRVDCFAYERESIRHVPHWGLWREKVNSLSVSYSSLLYQDVSLSQLILPFQLLLLLSWPIKSLDWSSVESPLALA